MPQRRLPPVFYFLMVASCAALLPDVSLAQPQGIDEIVVSTQKRDQAISEVPINITAYDDAFLRDLGVQQFDELAEYVPGLEIQEQSANNPAFVIRGITSDDGSASIEPRVSVFQDGVSLSRSRGSYVELFDVERIEVAKGPQSTLFGRAALIGAINVIQAKASPEFAASFTVGAGNFEAINAEGFINGSLGGDVSGRLAFIAKNRDGYVDNAFGGTDFNSVETSALRASLNFQPSDSFNLDVIANYQQDKPSGTSFKSGSVPPVGGNTDPQDDAALSTFGDFEGGRDLGLDREVYSLTALADWQLSDAWSLSSITGYRDFESLEVFDPDGTGAAIFVFAEDAEGDQLSQEFRLNYDAGGALRGFVGFSYFHEEGSQRVPLQVNIGNFVALMSGVVIVPAEEPRAILPTDLVVQEEFTNFGETDSYDLFGDVSYDVNERLTLLAGLRYTYDDKTTGLQGRMSAIGPLLVNDTSNQGVIEDDEDFDDLTWRLVAQYRFNDLVNGYASYARGRRPEVIDASFSGDPAIGDGVLFSIVDAEDVDSYELGLKYVSEDGRLSADGSVYYYEYENFQSRVRDDNGDFRTINAGNSTGQGIELQVRYVANDWMTVFANATQNRARFDDRANGERLEFAGNRFRLNPDSTAALGAVFNIPVAEGELRVVPSFTWKSEVFFDDNNDDPELQDIDFVEDEVQDDYGLLNLRASYSPASESWQAALFVTNLLDEEYIIDAGNTGDAFGVPTFIAGPPRLYGASIRWNW